MNEASYRERASAPIRSKNLWWTALALSLLLSAVLLGALSQSVSGFPVKAVRWFLAVDEADIFAIPTETTESGVDP